MIRSGRNAWPSADVPMTSGELVWSVLCRCTRNVPSVQYVVIGNCTCSYVPFVNRWPSGVQGVVGDGSSSVGRA